MCSRCICPGWRCWLLALLIAWAWLPSFGQAHFDADGGRELLTLINQEREKRGIAPLVADERLTQAARKHTALMVGHRALSHQFDDEPPLAVRFADENLRSNRQGENVAEDTSAARAHTTLMNSPPHRANILNPDYDSVGIGVMWAGEAIYVTEDFAHRLADYSEPQADAAVQHAIASLLAVHNLRAAHKPQSQLRELACAMALNDELDPHKLVTLPGVNEAFAWTTDDPAKLPSSARARLSRPLGNGYAVGVCFAPSLSHPGGTYWVALVVF